jgi:hypothetical protein
MGVKPKKPELLKCPWCGFKPKLLERVDNGDKSYFIKCFSLRCKIHPKTPNFNDMEALIKLWNKRHE